jgi:hypothetical protein
MRWRPSSSFVRRLDSFQIATARAVALNPMDGFTLAYLGFLIAYAEDCERGGVLSAKARSLNPHHPGWYWFVPCFEAYRKGEYKNRHWNLPQGQNAWLLAQSTCSRRELRATRPKSGSERSPADTSDSEARECQTSSRGVSDLVTIGYGRTPDHRSPQSWP